ncbi:temptin-like [Ruditapes philippinarum]|uniref:temptin-like n=1 Tax=Ruditapes philippinarum TaxID=129788 RepID=UPI00295B478E|nr:temptin-like [Ruditapes philippinarum]
MFGYFLALGFVSAVSAHPYYADLIPNGHSVPNPCGTGLWLAVGHYDPIHHTHDKNPFGMAFAQAGHAWTAALCALDSDGDGKTNGEELGDPTCVWTQGTTPTGAATGHPGICNPVGSCSGQSFSCGCHGHNCVGK